MCDILSMLKDEERKFLLSDWNTFFDCTNFRSISKSRDSLEITLLSFKKIGHFDFGKIAKEESAEFLETIIKEKPALHCYPRKMVEYIFFAIKKV